MGFFSKLKESMSRSHKTEKEQNLQETLPENEEVQEEALETEAPEEVTAQEVEETKPLMEEPVEEELIQQEPVEEEPIQEEPVQEEPEQEAPVVEEAEETVEQEVEEVEEVAEEVISEEVVPEKSEEPEEPQPEENHAPVEKKRGFFSKIKEGLTKTRKAMANTLGSVFTGFSSLDDDFYDELEECLILADLGVETSGKAVEALRRRVKENHLKEPEEAKQALKEILIDMLNVGDTKLRLNTKPSVVLVIGVNGVGKTTTIGKLAKQMVDDGKKVLMCAGDTFRAAAADQLEIWANRTGADIVRQDEGADPAAVVFDGIQAAKSRGADVILCDTAGRLHNKANLMNELNKISRIINRELPDADKEILLVLDATTGQNGLLQAKQFKEIAGVTAMALTKLDGTAKGGIVVAVADTLQIPVKYIGVGEQADDLMPFDATDFVNALL